ncbi:hypothetical protein [Salipiger sp.]|uniref:hypothetical protein n=1 Tax=Salipiger sp. TaxID=2078585 RepID=UPI003A97A7F2
MGQQTMIAEKLAYFFDAADLGNVFEDWPEEIGLVLCLDDAGTCEMLLHHHDEGRAVLRKAGALLDRGPGEFAVVPPVEGYPTRRVMFSDEQKLLALVADEDDLAEMAADYLINYHFEQDRKARERREKEAARAAAPKSPAPSSEPFFWRPRLHLSEVRAKRQPRPKAPDIPQGYVPAEAISEVECFFAEGELRLGRRGVRLSLAPELVDIKTCTRLVQEVGFRDDLSRFVLPRRAVEGWQPGEPLVIDIPQERFPAGLRARFSGAARVAEVTITAQGVFVAPGAVIPEPEPAASEAELKAPVRRRRFLTPVRVAVVLLTGIGLTAGTVINAVASPDRPAATASLVAFDVSAD